LGIRVNQMWKWRQQLEREAAVGAVKRGRPADDELARVRRENARLKEENEILKKAATYFARESR
jgi:transposase-like protein